MVLNSIELSVYPSRSGSSFDGKFYYNACDIKTLKKTTDTLGIKNKVLNDACFFTSKIGPLFSERGVVVYNNATDFFSHIINEEDDSKLFVGLKEMDYDTLVSFISQIIKVSLETDFNFSFYLTINKKIHIICNDDGDVIPSSLYNELLNSLKKLIIAEKIELPKVDVSKYEDKDMNRIIQSLRDKIKNREQKLKELNKQIAEVESLIEESEYLDKQISDSKRKIEKFNDLSSDNLL